MISQFPESIYTAFKALMVIAAFATYFQYRSWNSAVRNFKQKVDAEHPEVLKRVLMSFASLTFSAGWLMLLMGRMSFDQLETCIAKWFKAFPAYGPLAVLLITVQIVNMIFMCIVVVNQRFLYERSKTVQLQPDEER